VSNEISISVGMSVSKGGVQDSRFDSVNIDMSGDAITHHTQVVGIVEEAIVVPADLTTFGFVLLKNLDDTNFIEIGKTTGVYTIKLKAGELALFRVDGSTLFALANTAACNMEIFLIED